MSYETTSGIDFFSSILESPIYSGTNNSEVLISSLDMEKLDELSTDPSFERDVFLTIGNTIDTREVVKALFTRTVEGTEITRTLILSESVESDHDIGEQVYCGITYRYLDEIKDILDEIDEGLTELNSTISSLSNTVDTATENITSLEESVSSLTSQVSNLYKQSIHVDLSDGLDDLEEGEEITIEDLAITVTPLIYQVPANCSQIVFTLPRNDDEESQRYILLDYSNCGTGCTLVLQTTKYDPAEGSYPHKIVSNYYHYSPKELRYGTLDTYFSGSTYEYLSVQILYDLDIDAAGALPITLIGGAHLIS